MKIIPIILIHGLGDAPSVWNELIAHRLLAPHRCTLFSLPGSSADFPWNGESLDDVVDRVVDLIDLQQEPVVLIGHSLGGMIAGLATARRQDRVLKCYNVDSGLTAEDTIFSREASIAPDIASHVMALADRMGGRYGATLRNWDPQAFAAYAKEMVPLQQDETFLELYAGLEVPTLYLASGDGTAPASKAWLAEGLIEFLEFSGDHWIMEDHLEEIASLVSSEINQMGINRE